MRANEPDPADVQDAVAFLTPLSEDRYADALATYVMAREEDDGDVFGQDSPDPVTRAAAAAAFRSPALAGRSVAAARFLNTKAQENERAHAGKDKAKAVAHYRAKVSRERTILETVLNGYRAQAGVLDTRPNPRRRAERRLWQESLRGDVPRGRGNDILAEEVAKDEAQKAERKAARKAARDAAKVARRQGS